MAQADFRSGLQNDNLIEITVTGRSSGRPISLPIWFASSGNTLFHSPFDVRVDQVRDATRREPTDALVRITHACAT